MIQMPKNALECMILSLVLVFFVYMVQIIKLEYLTNCDHIVL